MRDFGALRSRLAFPRAKLRRQFLMSRAEGSLGENLGGKLGEHFWALPFSCFVCWTEWPPEISPKHLPNWSLRVLWLKELSKFHLLELLGAWGGPNILDSLLKGYISADLTVSKCSATFATECTAVAAIRLRMRMRILTRPENSLANCGNQVPKKKLRIQRCEGVR